MTVFTDLTAAVEKLNTLLGDAQLAGYHVDVQLDVNALGERTVQWDVHADDKMQPDMMTYHLILRDNENGHGHTPMGRAEFAGKALTDLLEKANKDGVVVTPVIEPITNQVVMTMRKDELDDEGKPVVKSSEIRFEKPLEAEIL